ncbi:MAG: SUMF1/EgtB/PvdO family nonheme iron enzyme [Candidatus Scalindua sp.]|nr:SUMF1/EgtB/PvdO family nonheme iron enzyme [Candidatus Scalindua sp.]
MKTIKIFLASSGELSKERKEVELFISSENKKLVKNKVFIELVIWEELLHSFRGKRIQDYFNEEMIKCDVVLALFFKKVGQFTKEEFDLAYENLKEGKKPKYLFVYFKSGEISIDEVDEEVLKIKQLKNEIKKHEQIYGSYNSNEDLKLQLKKQIDQIVSNLKKRKPSAKKPVNKSEEKILVIPETYRDWLEEHCAYMNIDRLQERGKAISVSLPEIYIPLYTQKPGKKSGDEPAHDEKERQIDIEELIGKSESLLIEGHPGSGKTTLLKHLAYALTQNKTIQDLEGYLPLLIFLKDTKDFLESNKDIKPSATTAKKILSSYYNVEEKGIDMETIEAFCGAKKTLLLLDGLDEIKPEFRDIIVKSFADYRIKHKGVKVVLSGRPHGIDGAAIDRFGKGHVKILSLNMEQIEVFIKKWFHHIYAKSSSLGGKTAEGMISEIRTHPAIERLIDNPLMLTAICILYHDGKVLPGQRAELYKKFVDNMLYRRFKDPEKVREFLMTLAFEMHSKGVKGEGRNSTIAVLRKTYNRQDKETEKDYRNRIEKLFDDIEPNCGLLKLEDGEYQFWHLTFQEYLTARYIIDDSTDYIADIDQHWGNDWYNEVIELYIGSLSIENRNMANKIVENIVNKDDKQPYKKWLLASRSMIDLHKARRNSEVLEKVRERLLDVIGDNIKPEELVEAGEILGWLGDTRDLKEFVKIPGGKFKLAKGTADIKPLEISKYPVTNRWFEEFINAGGYKKEEYWSKEGKKWLDNNNSEHPKFWNDRKWKCPNSPVVGVSWYEVYAFTRWLTIELKDGYEYRLPDENEWEAVAAGTVGWKYPWGDKWDKDRCNNDEIGIDKTSSVGIFNDGKTPEGIFDMSGNVWEWTSSYYDNKEDAFVLRGGSWNNGSDFCRCANRDFNIPYSRGYYIGFRCARTLTL